MEREEATRQLLRAEKAYQVSCDAEDLQWCLNLGVLYDEYGRHAAVLVAVRQDLGNVFRRLRVLRDKIRSSRPDLVGDDDGDDE